MISVIIPSRGESVALWATVASAHGELELSGLDFEIIVVLNEPEGVDFPPIGATLKVSEICQVVYAKVDGPAGARNVGFKYSKGDFLFFADAHCVFQRGFFETLLDESLALGADAVFGGTRFVRDVTYGCKVGWQEILWGCDVLDKPSDGKPFPIVAVGHGAFGMAREAFVGCGMYWEALRGWGGEEPQLNFKLWMMGYRAFMIPQTYHWHYTPLGERRSFDGVYRDRNFVRNFLLVAAAYGGDDEARRVYDSFELYYWKSETLHREVLDEVLASSEVAAERTFIAARGKHKNLAELREMFEREGVVA